MPTRDRRLALDAGSAEDVVARAVTSSPRSGDRVGLEVEFFPVALGPPTRRVTLDGAPPTVRRVLGVNATMSLPHWTPAS